MNTHSPKPILSNEEVQRIIDERLEVILDKEAAASQDDGTSESSRKECAFFHRLAGLFRS